MVGNRLLEGRTAYLGRSCGKTTLSVVYFAKYVQDVFGVDMSEFIKEYTNCSGFNGIKEEKTLDESNS